MLHFKFLFMNIYLSAQKIKLNHKNTQSKENRMLSAIKCTWWNSFALQEKVRFS